MSEQALDIIALWGPAVLLALSLINKFTVHYTKFNGVLRIVMAAVEYLSILASKNTGKTLKVGNVEPDPVMERMIDVKKQVENMARFKKIHSHKMVRRRKQ